MYSLTVSFKGIEMILNQWRLELEHEALRTREATPLEKAEADDTIVYNTEITAR